MKLCVHEDQDSQVILQKSLKLPTGEHYFKVLEFNIKYNQDHI